MRNSINRSFDGSHFHHMHINDDNEIGLFIPSEIHNSIYHNGKTGKGIRDMNNAALRWLCQQTTIKETTFDVNNIKINGELVTVEESTLNELRALEHKEFGDFTDDKAVWTLCLEHRRMKTEIELLKMKLEECLKSKE